MPRTESAISENRAIADDIVRTRLLINGQVQGVFFRDCTREQAQHQGVAGWARNRADGSVEIVLEGSERAVATVVAFCEHGPPDAQVRSVDTQSEEPEGLAGFEIR